MKTPALKVGRWLQQSRDAALDLLLPPRCGSCAAELPDVGNGVLLCAECRAELQLIDWPTCLRCAAPIPAIAGVELACNHCRGDKLRFDRTIALGGYEGLLRKLVMRAKTDRNEIVVRTLADLSWYELGTVLAGVGADVVTAVPMHPWRRWQRGANCPRTLAERLAKRLGVPAGDMLRLVRNVPPQIGLSRPARFRNIAGEMAVRTAYYLEAAHVLLIDDILTTGATCSEAARALRRAGAAEVTVFVLARTQTES